MGKSSKKRWSASVPKALRSPAVSKSMIRRMKSRSFSDAEVSSQGDQDQDQDQQYLQQSASRSMEEDSLHYTTSHTDDASGTDVMAVAASAAAAARSASTSLHPRAPPPQTLQQQQQHGQQYSKQQLQLLQQQQQQKLLLWQQQQQQYHRAMEDGGSGGTDARLIQRSASGGSAASRASRSSRDSARSSAASSATSNNTARTSSRELIESAFGPDADLYSQVLGVPPSATPSQIQGAFFDRRYEMYGLLSTEGRGGQEAKRRMDAVAEAYRVLSDPEGRARYDAYRRRLNEAKRRAAATAVGGRRGSGGGSPARPASILRNRSTVQTQPMYESPSPSPVPHEAANARNVTPSPPRVSRSGSSSGSSSGGDAETKMTPPPPPPPPPRPPRSVPPLSSSAKFQPRLTMAGSGDSKHNSMASDETETASNLSRMSDDEGSEPEDDAELMDTDTDNDAAAARRKRRLPWLLARWGGKAGKGSNHRASVADDSTFGDSTVMTAEGAYTVEAEEEEEEEDDEEDEEDEDEGSFTTLEEDGSILDDTIESDADDEEYTDLEDDSLTRAQTKQERRAAAAWLQRRMRRPSPAASDRTMKRRNRSNDTEGSSGTKGTVSTVGTAGTNGTFVKSSVLGVCSPVGGDVAARAAGDAGDADADADTDAPPAAGCLGMPACSSVVPSCRGAMVCLRDEVTGSLQDTASAFDQVFNAFTLKEDEIDAIADELEGVGEDLRLSYHRRSRSRG